MSDKVQANDRDEVLFAFHQECARPTAGQIIEWTSRYPQFADDIRAFAAISLEWENADEAAYEQPSEVELNRAFSNALNALYCGETAVASAESSSQAQTFSQILSVRSKTIPALARELGGVGIARSVLADLINGGLVAPVGRRFREALCNALSLTVNAFDEALEASLTAPRLGHAKASSTPRVVPRRYPDVIKTSGMSPEQIRYWLDED